MRSQFIPVFHHSVKKTKFTYRPIRTYWGGGWREDEREREGKGQYISHQKILDPPLLNIPVYHLVYNSDKFLLTDYDECLRWVSMMSVYVTRRPTRDLVNILEPSGTVWECLHRNNDIKLLWNTSVYCCICAFCRHCIAALQRISVKVTIIK